MAKKSSKITIKSTTKTAAGKPTPKLAQIVGLLQRQNGASIPELMKATGWQAHSVRGFISGTLKQKRGLIISSSIEGGKGRRYVIAEAP